MAYLALALVHDSENYATNSIFIYSNLAGFLFHGALLLSNNDFWCFANLIYKLA